MVDDVSRDLALTVQLASIQTHLTLGDVATRERAFGAAGRGVVKDEDRICEAIRMAPLGARDAIVLARQPDSHRLVQDFLLANLARASARDGLTHSHVDERVERRG